MFFTIAAHGEIKYIYSAQKKISLLYKNTLGLLAVGVM